MPAVKIINNSQGCYIDIPGKYFDQYQNLIELLEKKHGGFGEVHIGRPHKPRTTGRRSQNNLVHAFYDQLTVTGYSISEIKYNYVLPMAVKHGYPTKTGLDGNEYPKHESEISTIDIKAEMMGIFDFADLAEIQLYDEYNNPVYKEMYL